MDQQQEQHNRRRQAVLQGILRNGSVNFEHLPEALRHDAEIAQAVLHAVKKGKIKLYELPEFLCDNTEIALAAIKRSASNCEFVSNRLKRSKEFVLEAVKVRGGFLKFSVSRLRGNREIVLEAVRNNNGKAFQYASEELRGDREIVLAALGSIVQVFRAKFILDCVSDHALNDPVVAGAFLRKGLRLPYGSELMERLESVLVALRALPKELVVDEASYLELFRQRELLVWHKIWMALQLEPSGMDGTGQLFVKLSGLPQELGQARELHHCAPVVGAVLSSSGRDWRYLNSYYLKEGDDGDYYYLEKGDRDDYYYDSDNGVSV